MAQIDLGSLFIKIGANTEALNGLPAVLKNLESSISKLDVSVTNLNTSMSKSYQGVANAAAKSAEVVKKSEMSRIVNMESVHSRAIELDKKFDAARKRKEAKEEASIRKMTLIHMKALEMDAEFDASRQSKGGILDWLINIGNKAKGASNHLSAATSKSRNMGLAAQNTAYQLQDMIVQLEMGTPVARVLGQQLPQLFGGFGKLGAYAGVAAAGLAIAIPYLFSSGESAEEAAKKVDKYTEALDLSKSITDELKESQAKLNGTMSDFKLKDISQEIERVKRKIGSDSLWDLVTTGSTVDKLHELYGMIYKAEVESSEIKKNSIKADILQTSTILNQTAAYNKGLITLREYGIQKKIIEEIESQGIQGNEEAIRLLKEGIRLQEQQTDEENFVKIAREVADLNIALSQANRLLETTTRLGTNAGERLTQSFEKDGAVKGYYRALKDGGEVQAQYYAEQLNISTAGLSNEEMFNKVATAMANKEVRTKSLTTATANLVEVQKTTAELSDRIASVKVGQTAVSQAFSPDAVKRAAELEKRTREIARGLEFKAVGDTGILVNTITHYAKVAEEAGMAKPFEGINPNNARQVAEGVARVEQYVTDLDQSLTKLGEDEAFKSMAREIQRAWMEMDTLANHGEFAAKKLKDSFEIQDIFEKIDKDMASLDQKDIKSWEQLEKAVKAAADQGVDVSQVYTFATNSSTALRDASYGLALALAQVKIRTQEAADVQARTWDSSAIVDMDSKINAVNQQLDVMGSMTFSDKFINMFDSAPLEKMIQKQQGISVMTAELQKLSDINPSGFGARIDAVQAILERLNITGHDLTTPQGLAGALSAIDEEMVSTKERAKAVLDAVSSLAGQASSLFGQLSSMYAQQASYHKQMADKALQYGRDQANLYMDLADAVHYSNNKQAQSFEAKAIAAADAAAKQYNVEKEAQAKSNAMAKKNFEIQKKLQIAQAVMNSAMAITNILASPLTRILGPAAIPLAIATGAIGLAQVAMIQKQQFTPRKDGGSIRAGQTYLGHEEGPELFVAGRSGTMISQKEIMAGLMGSGDSSKTEVTFNINALDTQSAADVIMQNRGMIVGIIDQANNRRMKR